MIRGRRTRAEQQPGTKVRGSRCTPAEQIQLLRNAQTVNDGA